MAARTAAVRLRGRDQVGSGRRQAGCHSSAFNRRGAVAGEALRRSRLLPSCAARDLLPPCGGERVCAVWCLPNRTCKSKRGDSNADGRHPSLAGPNVSAAPRPDLLSPPRGGRRIPSAHARPICCRFPHKGEGGRGNGAGGQGRGVFAMTDNRAVSARPRTARSGFFHPQLAKFLEGYGIVLVVIVMMLVLAAIRPEV